MAPSIDLIPALLLNLLAAVGLGLSSTPADSESLAAPLSYVDLPEKIKALPPDERDEFYDFVAGNTLFVIYHEAGHMLVSELQLPVLAQEEDAVDNLATVSMLAADSDNMDIYLYHAMIGWFLIAEEEYDALVFYGEHDLDQQRGYSILCMMVGADEDAFLELAEELGLPDDRIESCAFDYEQAADSWEFVTDPYLRDEDTPAGKIKIAYEQAPADLKVLADFLEEKQLMELVADELDTFYDLPEEVTFKAAPCGMDNAFWDAAEREVTICYELLGGFAELYLDLLSEDN